MVKPMPLSKGQKFEALTKQVDAQTMALRLNQMMIKRMSEQIEDLNNTLRMSNNVLNDFQYRFLALQQMVTVDVDKLQALADQLKLKDFEKELSKKDEEEKVFAVDSVESDSDIVIITSSTPECVPDQGILRSRIKLADTNQPDLMAKLQGKKAGDVVETTLNGTLHKVQLLGVRRGLQQVEAVEA